MLEIEQQIEEELLIEKYVINVYELVKKVIHLIYNLNQIRQKN
jgi:hypothetical protein